MFGPLEELKDLHAEILRWIQEDMVKLGFSLGLAKDTSVICPRFV